MGATQVPHAEILAAVKPQLAKDGVELDIVVFSYYVQPNLQVADKQLDANFFQHRLYLNTFNKDGKTNLVGVAQVHVEPFGGYSKKIKNLAICRMAPRSLYRMIRPTAIAPCYCCKNRA